MFLLIFFFLLVNIMSSFVTRDLAGEIERISTAVRAEPLNASHRLALARLRLVQGEYLKALQQFQLVCQFDAELAPEAQLVRMLVRAEQEREAVFAGKILPDLFREAPAWLDKMIAALREPAAAEMRREALDEAQPSAGIFGETSFEWIADGDERLGPVLEVILGGSYYWVPFEIVESLTVPAPSQAMDLVWAPVELTLVGQSANTVYMPSRYVLPPEGERAEPLLTGAETVWQETTDGIWWGRGRRMWYVDGEPLGMFEAGHITFRR